MTDELRAAPPSRRDLADALCFIRRHDHPDDSSCSVSDNEADRLVRALSARYDQRRLDAVLWPKREAPAAADERERIEHEITELTLRYIGEMQADWNEAKDPHETDDDLEPAWVAFRNSVISLVTGIREPDPNLAIAFAATTPAKPAALDVERLAKVLRADRDASRKVPGTERYFRLWAERLAAAYATPAAQGYADVTATSGSYTSTPKTQTPAAQEPKP